MSHFVSIHDVAEYEHCKMLSYEIKQFNTKYDIPRLKMNHTGMNRTGMNEGGGGYSSSVWVDLIFLLKYYPTVHSSIISTQRVMAMSIHSIGTTTDSSSLCIKGLMKSDFGLFLSETESY